MANIPPTLPDDEELRAFQKKWKEIVEQKHYPPFLYTLGNPSISPTDIEARGEYPYQEPERDEQGTLYGYKVLRKHCSRPECTDFVSPRFPAFWKNGQLESPPPNEHSMIGIHCTKRPDHPELKRYWEPYPWIVSDHAVLVMCALYGTVIETEQGFRAENAMVVGVYQNGNWQSYQDYQECARTYSRQNPWQDQERWRAHYTDSDS